MATPLTEEFLLRKKERIKRELYKSSYWNMGKEMDFLDFVINLKNSKIFRRIR